MESAAQLKERVESLTGRRVHGSIRQTDDTSDYMSIIAGTVIRLGERRFYVTGDAREGRFGIDEQPKFWVKYAYDLGDGSRKILKLVFHEQFTTSLGAFKVRCVREPDKESRILDLVRGDPRFMQGETLRDVRGNNIRVLDFIRGESIFRHVADLDLPHERYFREVLPGLLDGLAGCVEAIAWLHDQGEQHGDIRNDHIFVETDTGRLRWIDFDYAVNYLDYDVWSLGNLLVYAVAKGIVTCRQAEAVLPDGAAAVCPGDALLFYPYRLANLRKLYPYVPESLNDLLMLFSADPPDFLQDAAQVARAIRAALSESFGSLSTRSGARPRRRSGSG